MPKQVRQIEQIEMGNLSISSVYDYCISLNRPVLITNVFAEIPALSKLSLNNLTRKLKNKIVRVNTSTNGVFDLDPQTGNSYSQPITMGFKDYIKAVKEGGQRKKLYMQQISIPDELPELNGDIEFIKKISPTDIQFVNLWVGPGGNTSPLHYDLSNNFFIQIHGNKKIWLYKPMDFYYLYPNSWRSKAPHLSRVNPANPDFTIYPKLLKAQPFEVTVTPGTILFLPSFWWHQVYSIDMSISINAWYKSKRAQLFAPGYFHAFCSHFFNAWRAFKNY